MVISYTRRFIFIHIYKVAGSSITDALAPYAHSPQMTLLGRVGRRAGLGTKLILPRYKAREFDKHIRAAELQAALPSCVYDSFYKFAFVRNPWDWQVSLYSYMIREDRPRHEQRELVKKLSGFEEYLEWRIANDLKLQKGFLYDERGRLLVDFVGRFERIEADLRTVCARLGIRARLPHVNATSHRDYRTYYTPRTRKLVEENWREDVELFRYNFEGPREGAAQEAEISVPGVK